MAVSRRTFLAASATVAAASTLHPDVGLAAPAPPPSSEYSATTVLPAHEVIALHRMGYGPRPGDIDMVRSMGFAAYVEQQLNPQLIDDSACDARIASARMRISYPAGNGYPALNELRGLTSLNKAVTELWPLARWDIPADGRERMRPFEEVRAATWLRAVNSRRQLQEVMVEFWHNHFNVYPVSASAISCSFPAYDRTVIRKHCFGNFREFLEAVASSPAMLFYLDNVSNRTAGGEGGNENYARELIELHTLGIGAYLKFYDDRRDVGDDGNGNARGYIDDDVYEAARCFTGWTVANGTWNGVNGNLPNTGEFIYMHNWHDTAGKTFLSPDGYPNFSRNQPAMSDGRRVLDLLAQHPATARNVCTKLCRRLIGDNPPPLVLEAAVAEWLRHVHSPDQIKRVVRVILMSEEFSSTWGAKVKRPFEFVVSYIRGTGGDLANDFIDPNDASLGFNWSALNWRMNETGHSLYEWASPNGYPDVSSFWVTTNGMMQRWKLPFIVAQQWGGAATVNAWAATPSGLSCTQIVDYWINRLCGFTINPDVRTELIAFMAQGNDASKAPEPLKSRPDWGDPNALKDRLSAMVQLLAMSPDFQMR